MIKSLATLTVLTAALSACAPVEEDGQTASADADSRSEGRDCFFARSVSGYRDAPDAENGAEQIYVDVGASDTYLFETFGSCPQLDFSWRIGLRDRGIGQICRGFDVDLIIPDTTFGTRTCPVRMIRKLEEGDEGMQN